ncbi:unnamed protein product [Rhizophagus irregularis]|uniref:VLIG-type G domain-containing protein n=1 Tax=Rhizophagus irregularis TaxID=588596 RepID=A0A915Z4G7_9GLOM|nr:unnamed protein product [Rhizophagus irregularis]
MFQNPIIVVCSGGLSGLIFALSLSEVFVAEKISGKILLYHEDYKIRDSKDQLFLLNKNEILRLPQSVRDYVSSPCSLHKFEDRLLELIKKLPKETVQLIHERFDPAQTSQDLRFDLLVLADGYSVDLCDSCQFEKEVISNHYELEIKFNLADIYLQNSETEVLSLFQTRYLMQLQQNNQNLKINLSKSEFDNIEIDSGLNSIKNNSWFTNIIQDGFRFFEINSYDLGSISKGSTDSLVNKEFYKSYQHGHNKSLVCVIGESAFNCKAWQIKSMSLEIAISTATILAEKISDEHEQKISLEITRNILDKFSNGMLNYKKELVHQFQLRSMDNILSQVIHKTINNYNKQYPDDQSSIDSSDLMTTLNKYPRLFKIDVLDQLKKEYVNNVKISAPEIYIKKLDRIQNIVNYLTIYESCLSSHKNIESNKGDRVELSQSSLILQDFDSNKIPDQKIQKIENGSISSEDSDDSSDNETQPESLSLEQFFQLTFGDEVISYDATNFVVDELTNEIFRAKVEPCLIYSSEQILDSKELDDPSQTLNQLVDCKGRDYLVAFLDKVPKKALSKTLISLTRANIPIPLLFTNKNDFNQKGFRVLKEIQSLILRDKYHLLLFFNLTTNELTSPFSKMLYPNICKHREDGFSTTSVGSIDISFHPVSENYGRKPVAMAEIYFEENPHQTFLSLINSFSQFAFYIFLHVNDQDFEGNSPSSELNQLLNTILAGPNDPYISKISVIYWSKSKKNNDPFSKRKKILKKLLEPYFKSECIKIEQISSDLNQFNEKKKVDVMKKLSTIESKIVHPSLVLKLLDGSALNIWKSEIKESTFASTMESIDFNSKSDIFRATYLEHEIEALNDKKSRTESQENSKFISEGEILNRIQQYRKEQLEISTKKPLSIFINFAKLINENNIVKVRKFAYQIDDFFKEYLRGLQNSNNDIKRTKINQIIEENDISIHDFWLEFIILSELNNDHAHKSVLEQLYNVNSERLQEAYKTWILEGEPLQLLDGLSLRSLPTEFLFSVLNKLMTNVERKLIVISVIGLESSGKSTLLNYLFHCGFATSASRCTKGVYMSYRTTNFDRNMIDILILDSEGIASTAQKYFIHRTSFDEKITLLALMCSQIVIINAKGLTRDISGILEVSSCHLDDLRHSRQSKPRLHFVLRDMIETIETQEPAFKDIVGGIRKMFKQIPNCVDTLEDFMSVEQQDVHLLVNAFCCYQDDFLPGSANIGKTGNVYLPAEVFPAKISSLRQSLLKSALLHQNTPERFTNVQGFISCMETVWSKINTYELHFENYKAEQAWNRMRNIVSNIKENELPHFNRHAEKIVKSYAKKIESDYSKWTQIEGEFRTELDLITNNWTRNCLKCCYSEFVQEQFDATIVEEENRLIRNIITEEKREQDALWMSLVREHKDSWLSQCAIEKVEIWKEVEDDKIEFNRQMALQSEELLEQHVRVTFDNAVDEFISTVRQGSKQKEKEKFKRDFWTSIKKPSTLEEYTSIDIQQQVRIMIEKSSHYKFLPIKQNMDEKKIAEEIENKLKQTINGITYDLKQKISLRIECGQAIQWLETLCNFIFEFTQQFTNKIEFKYNFDFFEKYLRSQIYETLRNNTIKWENQQKENLDNLKKNLLLSFEKILTNFSNESLSNEVHKYLSIAFKQQISEIEESVDQSLQNYLRESCANIYTATYMQSIDKLQINEIREYLKDPTEYMNKIFNSSLSVYIKSLVNSKLCEIDNYCKNTIECLIKAVSELSALFDSAYKEYEQLQLSNFLEMTQRINMKETVDFSKIFKDVDNLLGSVTIEKPVDFCKLLCKSMTEGDIQNIWTDTERHESKKRMDMYLETKISYYNQIGCSVRCPLCSSKCELPDDGHTHHQVTKHLLPAFNGFHNLKTKFPILFVCTENVAYESRKWAYGSDSNFLTLTEFLSKYHPSWPPFPRSEPSDEHIKKMRAIWWKLKDELCEKYSMIDNTDPLWKFKYGNLISE